MTKTKAPPACVNCGSRWSVGRCRRCGRVVCVPELRDCLQAHKCKEGAR